MNNNKAIAILFAALTVVGVYGMSYIMFTWNPREVWYAMPTVILGWVIVILSAIGVSVYWGKD